MEKILEWEKSGIFHSTFLKKLLSAAAGIKAVLNLDSRENVKLKPLISNDSVKGKKQYELIGGKTYKLNLKYM